MESTAQEAEPAESNELDPGYRNDISPKNKGLRLRIRSYLYNILLLFVVAGGLPLVAVPNLRERFFTRLQVLRDAMRGITRPSPLVAHIGENPQPFPHEFEKPAVVKPAFPQMPSMGSSMQILDSSQPLPKPAKRRGPVPVLREPGKEQTTESVPSKSVGAPETGEPVYKQGQLEKEAYDILLQSNDLLAGMVGGTNPSLRFKSWDAAKIEEDVYYVRLIFVRQPQNADADYIWQVRISVKQVTPLSYSARSLLKP